MTCPSSNATPISLSWDSGDVEQLKFYYKDSDKNPIDMTGCTLTMQIRKSPSAPTVALPNKIGEVDIATGCVVFRYEEEETEQLNSLLTTANYIFLVQITSPEGDKTMLFEGNIEVSFGLIED